MNIFISNVHMQVVCELNSLLVQECGGEVDGVAFGGMAGRCVILAENTSCYNYFQYIFTIKVLHNHILWSVQVCELKRSSLRYILEDIFFINHGHLHF